MKPRAGPFPAADETLVYIVEEDAELLRTVYASLSKEGYEVEAFSTADEAAVAVRRRPPTILITGHPLGDRSGLELAETTLAVDGRVGIVLMTGEGDESVAQQAVRIGALDYLIKPFEPEAVTRSLRRLSSRLAEEKYSHAASQWLQKEVSRTSDELAHLTLGVLSVLVNALEARYEHFAGHSQRVASVAERVARHLGLGEEEVTEIRAGALLHDIGMISVPDRIVEKAGDLTEEEYAELKLHCQRGADIVAPLEIFARPSLFILEHHERIDGSGYPLGLEGDAISLGGQIVGIAETWIALIEERPYRSPTSREEAFEILSGHAGTRFEAELVEAVRATEDLEDEDSAGS